MNKNDIFKCKKQKQNWSIDVIHTNSESKTKNKNFFFVKIKFWFCLLLFGYSGNQFWVFFLKKNVKNIFIKSAFYVRLVVDDSFLTFSFSFVFSILYKCQWNSLDSTEKIKTNKTIEKRLQKKHSQTLGGLDIFFFDSKNMTFSKMSLFFVIIFMNGPSLSANKKEIFDKSNKKNSLPA